MFYGEYSHSIDRKGRLILPARFRDAYLENGIEKFFVTRGFEQCIFMFSQEEWRLQEQKFKAMPFTKRESRNFNRLFFSGAVDIVPDKQGRFVIPQYLKSYAQIDQQVVVIGVSTRIEIWSADVWEKFYQQSSGSFEDIAENMIDL